MTACKMYFSKETFGGFMSFKLEQIQNIIYVIREHRVMLDSDLAKLYGVETKVLNQAVRRNLKRFPSDFMFSCNSDELESLRSQIVTSNLATGWNYKRRTMPMLFTESGVAMLSSVLGSDSAIEVNISIMRIFVKLRSYYALEERVEGKIDKLESNVTQVFKVVFERLDSLEEVTINQKKRKKIGLKNED
ncbi:MAG: hypothetical protein ACJAT2_002582 [Bacteriovoracaceae bacterium]|jgi:hypothetical protein